MKAYMSKFIHGVNTVRDPLGQNEELREDGAGASTTNEHLIHQIRNKMVRGKHGYRCALLKI